MQLVAIPKNEYRKILQNQEELRSEVSALRQIVAEEFSEELRPSIKRRLERISKEMDQGRGHRFKSVAEFKKFMHEL